jgi:hypothetical protein
MNALAETCPPLEDIAAFLDHKMAGEERDRFMAHLVDCEECYPVFADSARFMLEEEGFLEEPPAPAEAAPPVAPVVPLRRKGAGAPRWALPLAAVLVLGLATIPLYIQASGKPEMLSAELVDPAALQNVPTESVWNQDKRGEPDPGGIDQSPFEFLVGVHLVDLRFTLARGDKEETMNVLARISGHMKGLLFVQEQAGFYEKAVADLDQGRRTLTEVAAEAERVEAELTKNFEEFPHLAFGKWAEAGRLSAKAKNPAFFEDRDNRRFPGWLLRNAEEDLGEEIAPRVKRIRGIFDDSDPSKLPYEDLEKQFEAILQHYQHEADAASL